MRSAGHTKGETPQRIAAREHHDSSRKASPAPRQKIKSHNHGPPPNPSTPPHPRMHLIQNTYKNGQRSPRVHSPLA